MHKLIYTKQAEKELINIFKYIASDKKEVALEHINKLKSRIELLQSNPLLGVSCQSKNINKDCRVLIFEDYLIFYKVRDDNEILIIRILHGSMNYQKKV